MSVRDPQRWTLFFFKYSPSLDNIVVRLICGSLLIAPRCFCEKFQNLSLRHTLRTKTDMRPTAAVLMGAELNRLSLCTYLHFMCYLETQKMNGMLLKISILTLRPSASLNKQLPQNFCFS